MRNNDSQLLESPPINEPQRFAHPVGWQALSVLILVATLVLGMLRPQTTFAADKLTPENVAGLLPQLFRLHLSQHEMAPDFTKRMLKEYLTQLDPAHRFYLKPESEAIINRSDEELKKIGDQALAGDFSTFRSILEGFLNTQIARDEKLFGNLDARAEEIRKEAERRDAIKKTADSSKLKDAEKHNPDKHDQEQVKKAEDTKPADAVADDDEDDIDKIKWTERPATQEEREMRLIKSAAAFYRVNSSYLSDSEAMKLTLQNIEEDRKKWLKTDVAVETPKLFLKAFMGAMDPHTVYFDGDDEKFGQQLEPTFAGIGVQIRPCPLGAQIEDIIKGGPAEKSNKFARMDQIVAVDNVALAGLTINKIVQKIKGEKGTEVKLTVLKRETKQTEIITIKREEIQLADMRIKVKKIETPVGTIGLVSVQNFYRNVHKDVKDRILEAQKEKPLAGIVLDLRYNQGGYLEEAVGLAGLFIETGPVVGERNGQKQIDWKYDFDNFYFPQPLVILTSQFSASASEIVAGSLQDYGRALIVGPTQTFGKGTVQRVIPLDSTLNLPGEIKITTHQYFLAGGASTQLKGVVPDVVIPGLKIAEDMLEKASDNPVPWNRIDSRIDAKNKDVAIWESWKKNNVAMLQEKSKKRVDANQEYKDFFDLKKRKAKADAEKAAQAKRKPDEPPPPVDKTKDEKDPQADEAVNIVADMTASWNSDKAASNKPVEETIK